MTTSFVHDPRRDASSTIRGFVYQVDLTIRRWLELREHESLELERGEDIDLIARGVSAGTDEERLVEQVKNLTGSITLRSGAAVEGVANFAQHRARNPGVRLFFRLTTTATVGREQGSPFPAAQPGIIVWSRLRNGEFNETEELDAANALRTFYRGLERLQGINEETWRALREFVDGAPDEQWLGFLTSFEWSVGRDQPEALGAAVAADLVRLGLAPDARTAAEQHRTLFVHVTRLLATNVEKRLTRADVATVLAQPKDAEMDGRVAALLDRVVRVEARVDTLETRLDQVESGTTAHRSAVDMALRAMQGAMANAGVPAVTLARFASPPTDPPPRPANTVRRVETVTAMREVLSRGWLALHGDPGSGKTQLAELIADAGEPRSIIWLRLTDVSPGGVADAVRAAFATHAQAPSVHNRLRLFQDGFRSAAPIRVVVLDDLPRLSARDSVAEDLRVLATEAHAADALVVSTSVHRLPEETVSSLGTMIREVVAPELTEDETRELLVVNGASDDHAGRLAGLVQTLGEGHAGMIAGIARYLQSRGWIVSVEDLQALLSGSHATSARREMLHRLLTSVADDQNRQLLYRMMLAIGNLTLGEVRGLADAKPTIDRPDERLSQLEGLWVQVEDEKHIRVPPLVRLLRPGDLDERVRLFCYGRLAMMRIRRGALTPFDVLTVVTYFTSAGAHHEAGLVLAQAFMELERLGPIPDSGLSDWATWPLPDEMPNGTKLLVRGTQIGMRLKWGKDVDYLLRDVETIFTQTTHPFEQSAIFITSGKLLTSDPDKAWRALPLLRRAIAAHDAAKTTDAPVVPIPESLWTESILLAGNSVSTLPQLQEWQTTVESLTPARRALLDEREDLESTLLSIANQFLLAEHRKPAKLQNWQGLVATMNEAGAWALRVNMPLLHAHAARITIVVVGEYLHDLDAALAAASTLVGQNPDNRGRGVIEAAIGKQFNLQNRWAEARGWFASALSRPASRTPLHFQTLLAAANAEQEFSSATSISYLRQASAVAETDPLLTSTDRFLARAELAIALFLAREHDAALDTWEEAGAMLLEIEPDGDRAKGRAVLFVRHSANFYFAAAGLLAVMQLAPREQRIPLPMIGQFEAELASLGGELDAFWRARVQVFLGKMSEARSAHDRAKEWGQRALAALAGSADAPTSIQDEAERLANWARN
jgi:tetratricopeptide (TPR) repeat protein